MLPHPTYDRLIALGLVGMAKAFEEQRQQPAVASLMFEERIGLLVDREAVERESRRLVTRLKFANLRQNATIEDLNTKAARGLDKALFAKLATGDWIGRRHDLLITGKTGTGKSWLACALGHKACRDDRSVLYYRVPRLLDALALARGDGRYVRLLKSLARVELLILDDWRLAPLTSHSRAAACSKSSTQQSLEALLADAVAPAGDRGAIERQSVLEEFLAAEILI